MVIGIKTHVVSTHLFSGKEFVYVLFFFPYWSFFHIRWCCPLYNNTDQFDPQLLAQLFHIIFSFLPSCSFILKSNRTSTSRPSDYTVSANFYLALITLGSLYVYHYIVVKTSLKSFFIKSENKWY